MSGWPTAGLPAAGLLFKVCQGAHADGTSKEKDKCSCCYTHLVWPGLCSESAGVDNATAFADKN